MDHRSVRVSQVKITLGGDSAEVLRVVQAAFNEAVAINNERCGERDPFDLSDDAVFHFVPGEFWLGPMIGFEVTYE